MSRLVFLGVGGGGYILVSQMLHTGGFYMEMDGKRILVDPGTGSLIRARENNINLGKLDFVLVSHSHTDHVGDANAVIEAMSGRDGGKGILMAEKHCLEGDSRVIDSYHENLPLKTLKVGPNQSFDFNGLKIETTPSKHSSPTVGFVVSGSQRIGYTSDGPYFKGQEDYFQNCNLLILNCMMPYGSKSEKHMNVDGAIELINKTRPESAVLQHFGFTMLRAGLSKQIQIIRENIHTKAFFAHDNMEISLDKNAKKGDLTSFLSKH